MKAELVCQQHTSKPAGLVMSNHHAEARRGRLAARCVGRCSSALPPSPPICSFIQTRGPIPASTAVKGSTRSRTWRNTLSYTPGRSLTCVRYAARLSARAPTSSPTAVNTGRTDPTAALAASTASNTKWSCGSTRRTTAHTADRHLSTCSHKHAKDFQDWNLLSAIHQVRLFIYSWSSLISDCLWRQW